MHAAKAIIATVRSWETLGGPWKSRHVIGHKNLKKRGKEEEAFVIDFHLEF